VTYREAVDYIAEVPKFTSKNKMENTRELLRRLGHPEESYPVIHVAGTNGKGSVCAFLESILRHAGYRTGLFTSPHLVSINERFQIDRQNCTDEAFLAAFEKVMAVVEEMKADGYFHPTYFELLFAVGMVLFAGEKIDILVMETGLGGRLDATNAVEHPVMTVITSISLDHTEYLGDTIPEIAAEKAGIIKPGVPLVYDARCREAADVIAETAARVGAPAFPYYAEMAEVTACTDKSVDFVLNNRYYDYVSVSVPFLAEYQVANSSLAMMAARLLDLGERIPTKTITEGIRTTHWRGRMEAVMPGVVLDGAHNADGIAQFLTTVKRVAQDHQVSLLFTAVVEKDYEEMIREICTEGGFVSIVVTQIEGSRKVSAEKLAEIFRKYTDAPVRSCESVREAFETALSLRGESILFCAGSLYLVGELEALLSGDEVQAH